jgi:hypothetical protein
LESTEKEFFYRASILFYRPLREMARIFLAFVGGVGIVCRVVVVLGFEEYGQYDNEPATSRPAGRYHTYFVSLSAFLLRVQRAPHEMTFCHFFREKNMFSQSSIYRSFLLLALVLGVTTPAFAIRTGHVVGWGANSYGQATPPSGTGFTAIAAGGYHSLALRTDGSIVGWGYNYYGQAMPPSGTSFVAVAAGTYHSLALRVDGSIVGWGRNLEGQATPPSGTGFVAIAAGGWYSLAMRADGSIVAWGSNNNGESRPPSETGFVAITAGVHHGLALRPDGSIVGWGYNNSRQATPPSGTGFVAIAAGMYHSLALRGDGSIVGWGSNSPALGKVPSETGFVAIAAGAYYSLALRADGSIVAWGWNESGQVTPPSGPGFSIIAPGYQHSLAIRNLRPVAQAGKDQILYADHTGKAKVKLDGGASSDPENDPLTYRWSWKIADANCNSTEPNFTTTLPVGAYTFTLVVSDGLSNSEPNSCTVTVIAPIRAGLMMAPKVLNAQAHNKDIAAIFTISSITRADLDPSAPITLWPFGIEAKRKMVFVVRDGRRTYPAILAFFDAEDIIAATPRTSLLKVQAETKLKDGRYAVGSDYIIIFHPPRRGR